MEIKKQVIGFPTTATVMLIALLIITAFPQQSFAAGKSCTLDVNCDFGEICGACPKGETCLSSIPEIIPNGGQCTPCTTSAECLKKTFDKSVPALGAVSPWITISILAVLITLLGAGIVYVIGHAFNIQRMKKIGKAEVFQAIASLMLIALLVSTELVGFTMIEQAEGAIKEITGLIVTGYGSISPFDVSNAFLRKMVDCGKRQYEFVYSSSVAAEYIANLRLHFSVKIPVLKQFRTPLQPFSFIPTYAKRVAEKEYLADELTWLTVVLYAQLAFMKFIEMSMFTIFLPIGIILRSFPPTRGAGAVLMAIAIGLYIVYPLVFTILYVGTPPVLDGCDVFVPLDYNQIEKVCPLAVGSMDTKISEAQATMTSFEMEIPKIKSGASSLRFSAYLYLIISLGATFIFVRSASGILGADISEMGRSMFRML